MLLLLVAGACGGSGSSSKPPVTTRPATTVAATPTTFGGIPGAAQTEACRTDAQTVQEASDAYAVVHGRPAANIDALVADGRLRAAPSSDHGDVIGYDAATVHVTARGACTVP